MDTKLSSALDKIYFPKKLNHEYVSEYLASKASDESRRIGKFNRGDNIERNVEITNYLVKKQLSKTTKKLEHKRKDYNEKRKIILEQWEDLRTKEATFRENFIRFNQFVKENEEKKDRATNKIVEQNLLKEEREKNMHELLQKCKEIGAVKAKMDKFIYQYKIYEVFLLKVIEVEDDMQSINDLLKRYETLVGARSDLNEIQQLDMMKLEKAKSNLHRLTEDYLNKITTMNNRVNDLQDKYEKVRQECKKWETIHKNTKMEATEKLIDIVAIKESCKKMYVEICLRKKMKLVHIDNVEKQLLVIKQAIGEYEMINKRVKDIQEKAAKESIEPKASNST